MLTNFYLQKVDGQLFEDFVFAVWQGLHTRDHYNVAQNINMYQHVKTIPVNLDTMVVGCVEDTQYYLEQLGVRIPPAMNVPDALLPMVTRTFRIMTKEEFESTPVCPTFVKSVELKVCKAGVIQSDSSKAFVIRDVPPGTKLLLSDVMDIVNEYRVFVHKNQILGVRQYNIVQKQYDHFAFPDRDYVFECLRRMRDYHVPPPVSYTLDVAVLRDGTTQVIECNDGWAVGSYGMDVELYTRFVKDRWMELLKLSELIP